LFIPSREIFGTKSEAQNPKREIRNPKDVRNPKMSFPVYWKKKPEISQWSFDSDFELRISFGLRGLGFRICPRPFRFFAFVRAQPTGFVFK
jgi:hypothetical protein